MRTLSSAIIAEKNKISTTGTWLMLLEVQFPNEPPTYLVNNNENVEWDGKTWECTLPFELDTVSEDTQGGLPTYAIRVSNVKRALTKKVDAAQGGNGAVTILRVVHSAHLDDLNPIFEDVAEVVSCNLRKEWITFTLGAENPLQVRSPRQRYLQNHCRYKDFKGELCGYTGTAGSCDRTASTCESLGNLARFGGFPGIGLGQGIYL